MPAKKMQKRHIVLVAAIVLYALGLVFQIFGGGFAALNGGEVIIGLILIGITGWERFKVKTKNSTLAKILQYIGIFLLIAGFIMGMNGPEMRMGITKVWNGFTGSHESVQSRDQFANTDLSTYDTAQKVRDALRKHGHRSPELKWDLIEKLYSFCDNTDLDCKAAAEDSVAVILKSGRTGPLLRGVPLHGPPLGPPTRLSPTAIATGCTASTFTTLSDSMITVTVSTNYATAGGWFYVPVGRTAKIESLDPDAAYSIERCHQAGIAQSETITNIRKGTEAYAVQGIGSDCVFRIRLHSKSKDRPKQPSRAGAKLGLRP